MVHPDCDIEVEDACSIDAENDVAQSTKMLTTSLPITRSKTVQSSFSVKSHQSISTNDSSLNMGASSHSKNLACSVGKANVVI